MVRSDTLRSLWLLLALLLFAGAGCSSVAATGRTRLEKEEIPTFGYLFPRPEEAEVPAPAHEMPRIAVLGLNESSQRVYAPVIENRLAEKLPVEVVSLPTDVIPAGMVVTERRGELGLYLQRAEVDRILIYRLTVTQEGGGPFEPLLAEAPLLVTRPPYLLHRMPYLTPGFRSLFPDLWASWSYWVYEHMNTDEDRRNKGAMAGAFVGGVAGAAAGIAYPFVYGDGFKDRNAGLASGIGVLGGLVAGAVIGYFYDILLLYPVTGIVDGLQGLGLGLADGGHLLGRGLGDLGLVLAGGTADLAMGLGTAVADGGIFLGLALADGARGLGHLVLPEAAGRDLELTLVVATPLDRFVLGGVRASTHFESSVPGAFRNLKPLDERARRLAVDRAAPLLEELLNR